MKTKLTANDLMNWWLKKYHNTTIEEQMENEEYQKDNGLFYQANKVTQAQHDEWYDWAIRALAKQYRWSLKYTKRAFAITYLNVSPTVKNEDDK